MLFWAKAIIAWRERMCYYIGIIHMLKICKRKILLLEVLMGKRLKVGIIGCGGIANGKHLPSLKAINRVDLVAFCDLIEEKAQKAARCV